MSEVKEYVTVDWSRKALGDIFAVLSPSITADFIKADRKDLAENYADAMARANVAENLAPYITLAFNQIIAHFLTAAANTKGERTTVSKHDEKGRILETIRMPIWAPVPDGSKAA